MFLSFGPVATGFGAVATGCFYGCFDLSILLRLIYNYSINNKSSSSHLIDKCIYPHVASTTKTFHHK